MGLLKLSATRAEKTAWAMNNVLVPAHMVQMISEIDATALIKLRNQIRQDSQQAPSYTSIIIKAVGLVMKNNPSANRAILGLPFFKKLYQFDNIDIALAVEKKLPYLPGLAYAPTIKDAAEKSLESITSEVKFLKTCTPEQSPEYAQYLMILNKIPRPISNFLINLPYLIPSMWAKYRGCAAWVNAPTQAGVDIVTTSWPWPLTFSFGVIKQRPFAFQGKVDVRWTIPVAMSFDRRIMGGGPASRLFAEFQDILVNADSIMNSDKERVSRTGHGVEKQFVS